MGERTVGGTLVSRICGLSPWGGPLSAYFELTADVQAERTASMSRGNALEASVLALWSERYARCGGYIHRPGVVRAESLPHAHASLDALGELDDVMVVLDAKTANGYDMSDWGADGSDRVPEAYLVQIAWYVGVCRAAGMRIADEAHLPVLSGPESELQWAARLVERTGKPLTLADLEGTGLDFRVCRVEWDEALFAALNERVCRFLADHVAPRIPPMPGPGDVVLERDARAVAKGLRAEGVPPLDYGALDASGRRAVDRLVEAVRQKRAWEAEEDAAKVGVQLLMGGCEEVVGHPEARVTWKGTSGGGRRFVVKLKTEE